MFSIFGLLGFRDHGASFLTDCSVRIACSALPARHTNNQHLNTRHPATPAELQTEVPSQPRLSPEAVAAAGPDIRTLEPTHVDPLKFCDARTSESIGSILVSGFFAQELIWDVLLFWIKQGG